MAAACLFLLIILFCSVSRFAAGTPSSDVAALQELLRAWRGKAPSVFDNWSLDEDADPCRSRWKGVVCSQTKSIINLHLNGANLSGGIPAAIGLLDELIILDLSGNSMLTSSIPSQIGNLRRLTHLKLSDCNFSGKVPQDIYNLKELQYLDLMNNPHLSLDGDAQEFMSLRRQQSFTFSHRRALLQVNGRTPLPIFFTYIALGVIGLIGILVFTFCFCRWLSVRKTRSDVFLMTPAPPIATTFQSRRIYANEAEDP